MKAALVLATALLAAAGAAAQKASPTYRNPLVMTLPDGQHVESCADPTVLKGQRAGDPKWTLVCTQDPLHDRDRDEQGRLRFRHLPMFRSDDLVHWHYQGEALPQSPPQAAPLAGLWAPELTFVNGRYRLYYTITDVVDALSPEPGCEHDSAIGAASSDSPLGPWVPEPGLVVPPRRAGPGCNFHWTFDPDLVVTPAGRHLLYYGSYGGGLWVQPLDASALRPEGEPVRLSRDGRYEGAEVVFKDGHYYLFASSTNCCNGALTGYSVFVGRSRDPMGPFVDREGHSFLDARIGGTPVIVQNGNRWVGPGHNTVFQDEAGRWWTVYHAVDRSQPHWTGSPLTRRPALLDRLDWRDGWPVVAGGPSAQPVPALPATPHAADGLPRGALLWRDGFDGARLSSRWHWIRQPAAQAVLRDGLLQWRTEAGDLHADTNNAALLAAALPPGDLWIEARVHLQVPPDGDMTQPVQAGLVLRGDDDRYLKLVHVALRDTRQTEFAIERPAAADGAARYGNTVVGAPGDWTTLALHVRRRAAGGVAVTAYTRAEGEHWVRGGTWVHEALAPRLTVGLVAMGGAGHAVQFDEVRVHRASAR